ncbi:MAG TPA: M28 family peptidase [Chroococcidiopsis sp.]
MKKLGILLSLLCVTAVGIILGWHSQTWQSAANPGVNVSFQNSLAPDGAIVGDALTGSDRTIRVTPPTIDPERLMTDVSALAAPRYATADRDRAQAYILETLQKAGWSTRLEPFESSSNQTGVNIYAERPGTDPQAGAILLGAHYDTVERSPGADDNATAVAAVLEAARLLGPIATARTLSIALFDLEEAGLVGSQAFVDQRRYPQDLRGAVILEMLGYTCQTDGCQHYPTVLPITPPTQKGDFLAVIGDQGHRPLIDSFIQASRANLPPLLTLPVPLLGPFIPDLLRSDHAPFWRSGIGAVMVTDTANFRNPHYHQPSDTLDSLDRDFFAGSTQLVVNALTVLLNGQDAL